jgi:hypothetical protein
MMDVLMNRWLTMLLMLPFACGAMDSSQITELDAASALKTALTQGATAAVQQLGKQDGFLGNPQLKIPPPRGLRKADELMRRFGMSAQADAFIIAMNRAAEAAVAEAKPMLVDAVKKMTVEDAKAILTGDDDAATQYFRAKTADALTKKFKPTVVKATSKIGLTVLYDRYASRADDLGLVGTHEGSIDDYVTAQALDALYKVIAQEEQAIRADPLGQASSILQRVFGAK